MKKYPHHFCCYLSNSCIIHTYQSQETSLFSKIEIFVTNKKFKCLYEVNRPTDSINNAIAILELKQDLAG